MRDMVLSPRRSCPGTAEVWCGAGAVAGVAAGADVAGLARGDRVGLEGQHVPGLRRAGDTSTQDKGLLVPCLVGSTAAQRVHSAHAC